MVDFCGLSQQKYANMLEKLGCHDGLNDGFHVLLTVKNMFFVERRGDKTRNKTNISMDWFKGKSTGNHRFSH